MPPAPVRAAWDRGVRRAESEGKSFKKHPSCFGWMHAEIAKGFHQIHSQAWSLAMVGQRERQLPELPTMAMEVKEDARLEAEA